MQEPFLGFIGTSVDTQLLLFNGESYEILGTDIDLSLGSAFSKVSTSLNLSIETIENFGDTEIIQYPVPVGGKGLDFSFAGAYFHTLQHIYPRPKALSKNSPLVDPCFLASNAEGMKILANSFQTAVVKQVVDRIQKSIKWVQSKHRHIRVLVSDI